MQFHLTCIYLLTTIPLVFFILATSKTGKKPYKLIMYSLFYKLIKFGLTGLLGMGIDFGTTWIVKEQLKWNKYIANCCGFLLAVVCNYWINRHWTFESVNRLWITEFSKFMMISLIGLALNTSFIYFFMNNVSAFNIKMMNIICMHKKKSF